MAGAHTDAHKSMCRYREESGLRLAINKGTVGSFTKPPIVGQALAQLDVSNWSICSLSETWLGYMCDHKTMWTFARLS